MALQSSNQHGASYKWGFEATDAPVITGFVARSAEIRYEPEVMSTATDGEGHVDSVTLSKPDKRKWTGTFTGYITDQWDPAQLAEHFQWENRKWFVGPISEPIKKGEYVEVSLEAHSFANVN